MSDQGGLQPLITRCPNCHTQFRVAEAQLQLAGGKVRCGACLTVFQGVDSLLWEEPAEPGEDAVDALDNLLDELDADPVGAPGAGPAPDAKAAGDTHAKAPAAATGSQRRQDKPVPAATSTTIPEGLSAKEALAALRRAEAGGKPSPAASQSPSQAPPDDSNTLFSGELEDIELVDVGLSAAAPSASLDRTSGPASDAQATRDADDPTPAPKQPAGGQRGGRGRGRGQAKAEPEPAKPSRSAPPAATAARKPAPKNTTQTPAKPAAGKAPEPAAPDDAGALAAAVAAGFPDPDNRKPETRREGPATAGDAEAETETEAKAKAEVKTELRATGLDSVPEEDPFARLSAKQSDALPEAAPQRRWLMVSLVLVGALLLVGQVLVFQFASWSQNPSLRGIYSALCPVVGCELPPLKALDRMESRNLSVRSHPDVPDALAVDTVIVNNAEFAQAFPVIELTFKDIDGKVVAGRRFDPEEYLAGELKGAKNIASRTPVRIRLEIKDPGPTAVSYKMDFR